MPMLFGSPSFAAPALTQPPTSPSGQAAFFKFVATPSRAMATAEPSGAITPAIPTIPITNWQLWNEVNTPGFWLPNPTPQQYASLLKPTANTLRSIDPSAKVVLSGLFPTAYIARFDHGGRNG